jgi:hypothetical protein
MTSKADYSDDEWVTLIAAPWAAGALVVIADFHTTGVLGEFKALALALTDPTTDGAETELVTALVADFADRDDDDTDHDEGAEEAALALLRAAGALIDERCDDFEAAGYRRWIIAAATATAEARKEATFFGIGGDRVSDAERAALDQIVTALTA